MLMITRRQIINRARRYTQGNVQGWNPTSDLHAFDPNRPNRSFHSAYTVGREYDLAPYVYGGFNSRTQIINRTRSGYCPGGWDRRNPLPRGIRRRTTSYWYSNLGYGSRVPLSLVGIDCSGYVQRCWGFDRRQLSTRTFPNICVQISRRQLKSGDILNHAGSHVRIFNTYSGDQLNIFESRGSGRRRAYQPGDNVGRVIQRNIAWDDNYIPLSPFPTLMDSSPLPGSYPLDQVRGMDFLASFTFSGNFELIQFIFDSASVPATFEDRPPTQIRYKFDENLAPGRHTIKIVAGNKISGQVFKDSFKWVFDAY